MQKISESGAYADMTMEQYHGDCCVGPSVSSTVLRLVETRSMRHAWLASHLNPDRKQSSAKSHFRLGSALHSMAFEGGLDKRWFAISPHDKFLSNEAKRWRDVQVNAGKTVIKKDEVKVLEDMLEALLEEPAIMAGLFDEKGAIETTLIHRDEETGLYIKARPDVVPVNTILTDLKSTEDARRRSIEYATLDYGYHQQLALAAEVIEKVVGVVVDTFSLVMIEKEPPHTVTIVEIDPDLIAWGRVLNRAALRKFADCLAKGPEAKNFPRQYYNQEIQIRTPDWYHAQLTRRQEAGELPTVFEACGPLGIA